MAKPRVLIVEDEIIVANNLRVRLQGLGYVVVGVAASGEQAIRQAAEMRPDAVLMDIKLPGSVSGLEAAQEIRTRFDVPVIYMTGLADDATLRQANLTDPAGYVSKPFELEELRDAIEAALHKGGAG
jgi:CheY-like chemotaxis protein